MPLALAAGIFLSCRSAPARAPAPEFSLVFDRVDMTGPGRVNLHFTLEAENLRDSAAVLSLAGYRLSVGEAAAGGTGDANGGTGANGTGTSGGTAASRGVLEFPAPGPDGTATALRLGPRGRKEIPVILHLDPDSIPAGTGDSAAAALAMNIAVSYGDGAKVSAAVRGRAEFPLIRDPVFSITSIVIMQAELINTRFKVRVRVDNPNPFPVELSSFKYELYGGGRFWADGTEQRVLSVPAAGRAEKELFLVMNFIDMKRDLLDQVIALEQVRYRFTGTVKVGTGLAELPVYTGGFDLEGDSDVTR